MGEQRSWNPGRTTGQEEDDLAAEVEAREVVVFRFGNAQTVAREDNRRLELRRRITRMLIVASAPSAIGSTLPPRTSARLDWSSTIRRDLNPIGCRNPSAPPGCRPAF